jgi:type IV pilus assembly protein PilV
MNPSAFQCRLKRRPGSERGFTMLEVLVALLILVIGLLGLAGLLVSTQQGEVEAYQRKQATLLVQDMVDRITANRIAAPCYAISDPDSGSPAFGTDYAGGFVCGEGSLSQQARGSADLQAWNDSLLGVSEQKAGASIGGVIEARGCVTNPDIGVYTISVAWRGLAPTVAPPAAYTCGLNQYRDATNNVDERLRRVISITIRIANLAA